MNWKEYLKTVGFNDQQIAEMEKSFGADNMSKALQGPLAAKADAEAKLAQAVKEADDFKKFYNDDILPKISTTFQDAINSRTEAEALRARLKAAEEYGFLTDPATLTKAGVPGGTPAATGTGTTTVNTPAAGTPTGFNPADYVPAKAFAEQLTKVPNMLARINQVSNEHFHLFGTPLLDVEALMEEAQKSGGRENFIQVWERKYKVPDKRTEIQTKQKTEYETKLVQDGVQKYLTEHNMPFSRPAMPSISPHFKPGAGVADARQPWKNAAANRLERRTQFMQAQAGSAVKTA